MDNDAPGTSVYLDEHPHPTSKNGTADDKKHAVRQNKLTYYVAGKLNGVCERRMHLPLHHPTKNRVWFYRSLLHVPTGA